PVLISGHGAYQTPLGPVMIAREACRVLDDALRQELGAGLTPVKGDPEHSIEIELPFLQRVLPGEWRLLPVMVRDQRREVARALGVDRVRVLDYATSGDVTGDMGRVVGYAAGVVTGAAT